MKKKCRTKRCRGKADLVKWHSPYCAKCRTRIWKARHVLKYIYHMLRSKARVRHIAFLITYSDFVYFCLMNDYIEKRGNKASSLTIDRIDSNGPYALWNMRAIPRSENTSLANAERTRYNTINDYVDNNEPF